LIHEMNDLKKRLAILEEQVAVKELATSSKNA
jgi:hypothetical protein